MFSSDKNIETIAQLVEELQKYIALKGEYFRLSLVEKIVRLLTALAMTFILTVLFLLVLTYLSFALASALEPVVGEVWGFVCVAAVYAVVFAMCIIFRKEWFERPLVRLLAGILMEEK